MADFDEEFKTWSESAVFRPRDIYEGVSAKDIADFVVRANSDDRRLRAHGSKWSFSDVALSHDYQISLASLCRVLAFSQRGVRWGHARQSMDRTNSQPTEVHPPDSPVLNAALRSQVSRTDRMFAHVHAGIILKELYLALDSPQWDTDETGAFVSPPGRGRWALPTQGGAAGQTIAGVVSTSTHGGDFLRPPIQEMVQAIDLIAPDGTRHWFERGGNASITDQMRLLAALGSDSLPLTQAHYDDDEFFAVLVSMGCMGIIYSLVLEVVPQYGLSQRTGAGTWRAIRDSLKTGGQFFTHLPPWDALRDIEPHPSSSDEPHALEIFVNPYRISDDYFGDPTPDRRCVVTSRVRRDDIVDAVIEPPGQPCAVALAERIAKFESGGPGTAKDGVDDTIDQLRTDTTNYPVGWSVLDLYSDPSPVMSLEIAIPTLGDRHLELVDEMLDRVDKQIQKQDGSKLAGAFSLRFTQPSRALLGIQNFADALRESGTMICHVEVICVQELKVFGRHFAEDERGLPNRYDVEGEGEAFLRDFEAVAERHGAHLHWGHASLTGRHSPQNYAGFGAWQTLRDSLTQGGVLRGFDNDFTVRYGISRGAPGWTPLRPACYLARPPRRHATPARRAYFPRPCFGTGKDASRCW
jgi:hypothetical protein